MRTVIVDEMESRVADLKTAIGREFSDNYSSTLRSRLIGISGDGKYCTIEEVPNELDVWTIPATGTFTYSSEHVHTAIWGV